LRWILLIAVVFGLCGGVAITYWRQSDVDVSLLSMIIILVLVPSTVIAGLYGINRFKKIHKRRNKTESESSADISEKDFVEYSVMPWLDVYSVVVNTQIGHHADQIILGLQAFKGAECDPELQNVNGSKILSRRIDLVLNDPIPISGIDSRINIDSLSVRARRIDALTKEIYEHLDPVLAATSEGMQDSTLWQRPILSQQAILHPAWQGQNDVAELPRIAVESKPEWPKVLKVLYLLPHHLELQDQQYLQQTAYIKLLRYGFNAELIQWVNKIVDSPDDTLQFVEQALEAQIKTIDSSVLLVMGVDSHLDQDLIDFKSCQNHHFIPIEASFSFLITNETTSIPTLPILSRLTAPILNKRQKPISLGGRIGADDLINGLDTLIRNYLKNGIDLIPQHGILVSDINPAKKTHLRELSLALSSYNFSAEELLYAGSTLESSDAMISGITLAIALQQAESLKLHVPVICSAGETLRGLWLAAPHMQISLPDEALPDSESSKEITEHA
jgi:hypothetical protein